MTDKIQINNLSNFLNEWKLDFHSFLEYARPQSFRKRINARWARHDLNPEPEDYEPSIR